MRSKPHRCPHIQVALPLAAPLELDGLDRSQHAESSYLDLAAFVKHATPTTDELFEGADLALGEVSPAKRRSGQSLSVRLARVEMAEAAMV